MIFGSPLHHFVNLVRTIKIGVIHMIMNKILLDKINDQCVIASR